MTPGATCTVDYIVSQGPFETQFCYIQNGWYDCLPPNPGDCQYATCSYSDSGGGGNPPATPISWTVTGNNATIIQMS